jgi:uncharacterized protein (UPF0335 family)
MRQPLHSSTPQPITYQGRINKYIERVERERENTRIIHQAKFVVTNHLMKSFQIR